MHSNLSKCLFCHSSQLLRHPSVLHASLVDLINRKDDSKEETDWKPEASVHYLAMPLTSVMGLCWTTYSDQKNWNTYLFRINILFKKRKCLLLEKVKSLPRILWLLDLLVFCDTHTDSLLISSFLRSLSEADWVHRGLLLSHSRMSEWKHFLAQRIMLPVISGNHVVWPSLFQTSV